MSTQPTMPVTWFSVPADDPARAANFYQQAFGWRIEPTTEEDDHAYDYRVLVNSPSDERFDPQERGRINGCIVRREIGVETPVVLLEVDDLDLAAQRVVAAGGSVVSKPVQMRSLDGSFILVRDPEGNMFELFSAQRSIRAAGAP